MDNHCKTSVVFPVPLAPLMAEVAYDYRRYLFDKILWTDR